MKINKAVLAILSLIVVTSSAFLLQAGDDSTGANIVIYDGEFTLVYDDSDSLHLLGDPGKREATLVSYNWNADSVAIPNTIDYGGHTYYVTVIGKNAFLEKTHLINVAMGDHIRLIEENAFWGCTGIRKVDLEGVTEVKSKAFMHCTSLKELTADHLVKIGDYAFALANVYNANPYPGPGDTIPYINDLFLPSVEEIGYAAFGARAGNSVAREFGFVSLPNVKIVGDYAFAGCKIDYYLEMSRVQTIGQYAFFLNAASGTDLAGFYGGHDLAIPDATSIGTYAFAGRAINAVLMSPTIPYTIGNFAFAYTELNHANLGMVSSIGTGAFDGIDNMEFFHVSAANTKYASLISGDPSAKGVRGALYSLDLLGNPNHLIRMPPGIKPLLADYGNEFVVADGVKSMEDTAFVRCPAISVDLNEILVIPALAFSNTSVTKVIAKKAFEIEFGAFQNCSSLASFEFYDGSFIFFPFNIGQNAFRGTRLTEIELPKNTIIGRAAFSNLVAEVDVVGVWGDTVTQHDSFLNTKITALKVSSDAATAAGAKNIFDNWNNNGWSYGGSDKASMIIVNNNGNVDISGLKPDGQGALQLMNGVTTTTYGTLQFVEYKLRATPTFHMMSIKAGVYWPESHGSAGSPTVIRNSTNTADVGSCYAGDLRTWELIAEYYEIVFISFDPYGDVNGNGIPDGVDPDYDETVNPDIFTKTIASRVEVGRERYLAGTELKTMLSPSFVRFSLQGWYVAVEPDYALTNPATVIYDDSGHRVSVTSYFGGDGLSIPENWVIRDSDDFGILYVYGLFVGKSYRIETEARLTGGQTSTGINEAVPNPIGGKVELVVALPDVGFDTGTTGRGASSYPYGTMIELRAVPNPGYAFVGWAAIDIDDIDAPKVIIALKDDRSLVQSHGTATLNFELPAHMKYVAFFAKTTTVTFDDNDGSPTTAVEFVVGDRLVEDYNDYNGHDYISLINKVPETFNTGHGTSYYPGTPTSTDLDFAGWFSGTTSYAGYDGTNLTGLVAIPNTVMTLKAKWIATLTFYPNDGINTATLTGTGLTEVSPGVFEYKHDVGTYVGTSYNAPFNYGPAYVPSSSNVIFNGWYVLGPGGSSVSDVEAVAAGTNSGTPYPDIYPLKERFEPGSFVNRHMSLIALYVANVEFYFNAADGVDPTVSTPVPYKVTAPVSEATTFGSTFFDDVAAAMTNAETTGLTYKFDSGGDRMWFKGWYETTDGSTKPTELETPYTAATAITKNVKLIAGWAVKITFDDNGIPGIIDQSTSAAWVPGNYWFLILEDEIFSLTHPGMPDIRSGGNMPTAWCDIIPHPYKWYLDGHTRYTHSVELIPVFGDLFLFDTLDGLPSAIFVEYIPNTSTFQHVLNSLNSQLEMSPGVCVEIEKPGLYYKNDGTPRNIGDVPNAIWYKSDGSGLTSPSTHPPIVYIGNESTLVEWDDPSEVIVPGVNDHAYIRWMAKIEFNVNVPAADADAGTSPTPPAIMEIDEGTLASLLPSPFPVPIYNTDMEKTFKGWFKDTTRYTDQYGNVAPAAPAITRSITLNATWGVEVKFYYTGVILTSPATTVSTGTDAGGDYIIIDVGSAGTVTAPTMAKIGFTDNHLMWYTNGFTGAVPVQTADFISSTSPNWFNTANPVTKNTTVYSRWYADVGFDLLPLSAGFFTTVTKNLLEGSHLEDLPENLNPYTGDVTRADWIFIGWFERTAATGYEDLGLPYFRTDFNYMDGTNTAPTTSVAVTKNVTLEYEYVVEVEFDGGYLPAVPIDTKWLRVNNPIPDAGPRFTPMPVRSGVTFTGWFDLSASKRYTLPGSDAPDNTVFVLKSMKLTALWLVTVKFYDLNQYLADGMVLNVDGVVIVQTPGPDGILGTADDIYEMPEGTMIRQFILTDPNAAGKTFISWFEELIGAPDGLFATGDKLYGLNDKIEEDIMLTAGYGYTMSFDTKGGTPSVIPDLLVIEGASFNLPESPAKGRLTFNGWDDGAIVRIAGASVTPTSNMMFAAKWLVKIKIFDGISMTPILDMEWDEDTGPSFTYNLTTSADYDGKIIGVEIIYTDGAGVTHTVEIEKFLDRYDMSIPGWVPYYSVFNGWLDPFTGTSLPATSSLLTSFSTFGDSAALFPTWQERVRIYDSAGNLTSTTYVDTGTYLGPLVPPGWGWTDPLNPMVPINPLTYRIRDSGDFIPYKEIHVTFNGNGGTPSTQGPYTVMAGTMVGVLPALEPSRAGMYFAGWYKDGVKCSFTDRLFDDATLTAQWSSTPIERYTVFASAYSNASITPMGMIQVFAGDNLTFTYYVAKGYSPLVRIDGSTIIRPDSNTYTFTNIRANRSIEVMADDSPMREATAYLTINTAGRGGVIYSTDGGMSFSNYTVPLPLYSSAAYLLKAVPGNGSYFDHWSGDASGTNPELMFTSDGVESKTVTANFGSSSGFGIGQLAVANLILLIISIVIGIVAVTLVRNRDYEGTGVGKALRFSSLFIALIVLVLFLLTQGFSGTYIPYDSWTIVFAILTIITMILAFASLKYDYVKD